MHRILIVDDNMDIHGDFKKILGRKVDKDIEKLEAMRKQISRPTLKKTPTLPYEYKIESAFQGKEAKQMVEKAIHDSFPFTLAFVDIVMPPGWDGIETVNHLWAADPNLQIVLCTAYSEYSWEDLAANLDLSDNLLIIKKPFDPIEIKQIAFCLTKKWELNNMVGHQYDLIHQRLTHNSEELGDFLK